MESRTSTHNAARASFAGPKSLADYIAIVRRHWVKCAAWVLLVAAGTAVALAIWPKKYISDAKLYVRLGREAVALDPTATTGQTMPIMESRENQINSARDMLSSRALAEQVVNELGAETVLSGPPSNGPPPSGLVVAVGKLKALIGSIRLSPAVSPKELAIRAVQESLRVDLSPKSSVIDVSYKADSPEFAQQVLAAYLSAYQQQYLKAHRTTGSQQFFTEQAKLLKAQWTEAVERLRDAKNATGVVSVIEEQKSLQAQRSQLESAQLTAEAALAGSQGTIASLNKSIAVTAETQESQRVEGIGNQAAELMQQELYRLQIKLEEAKSKYNDDHPLVTQLLSQLEEAERVVNAQPKTRVQITQAINPARAALELELKREEAASAAHRARAETLSQQLVALRLRLEKLNQDEVRIAQLERDAELAAANYKAYATNLEQARIDQALADDRISPVNIVQHPSLIEKPVSPRNTLLLALGAVVAFGGAVAIAWGSEKLDRSLRSPEDVEHQLGIPVLVSIPQTRAAQPVHQAVGV